MNQPPIIFFDGVCNLCCGWVKFLIRMDRKDILRFVSIQSENGKKLLNSVGLNTNDLKTIIYVKENKVYFESVAVLQILKDLDGIWKLSGLFQLIPKAVLNKIYMFIAKRRYRLFGKGSSCLLPTPENQKRFLL